MRKKIYGLIIRAFSMALIFIGLWSNAYSQNNKMLYLKAKDLFKKGSYDKSIVYAVQVKSQLKSPNPKVEALLTKTYFKNGNIVEAKMAYEKLLKLTPSNIKQSSSFEPFLALGKQINAALDRKEEEHEKKLKAIEKERMREVEKVERDWLAREEEQKRLLNNQTKNATYFYNKAKAAGTKEAYREFASSFPQSTYAGSANRQVEAIKKEEFRKANEENVWQEALNQNTAAAFQNYLNIYHDGKHIPEAKEHIYHLDAKALFNKIESTQELKYYEQYYNQYKRGKDFQAVKQALKQGYLNYGNTNYKNKHWQRAKYYFDNYLIMHGSANPPAEISQKKQKINRMLSQRNFSTFSFTYEDKSYGGIIGGDYYKDRTGFYFRIRMRSHVFKELEEVELDFPEGHDTFEEEGRYGDSVWIRQFTKTGNEAYKNFVFSAGITQKLFYPLWVNLGVGMGYFELWNEVEEDQLTRSGNNYYWEYAVKTAYDRDTDHPGFGLVYEGGLNLYLKPFVLHYGFSSSYGKLNPYFGIGLNL